MIQIGVNTIGQNESLERYAKSGVTAQIRAEILACVDAHRQAISLIIATHPGVRFMVAGIFDNSNIPSNFDCWITPAELANIAAALYVFEAGLRSLCADNSNITFIDARTGFAIIGVIEIPTENRLIKVSAWVAHHRLRMRVAMIPETRCLRTILAVLFTMRVGRAALLRP